MSILLAACGGEAEHRPPQPPTPTPVQPSASDEVAPARPAHADGPVDAAGSADADANANTNANTNANANTPPSPPAMLAGTQAEVTTPTGSAQDELAATTDCDRDCVGGDHDGDDILTPVDREHGLRPEWSPDDLIGLGAPYIIDHGSPPNLLREEAANALVALSDAAFDELDVRINIRSGYRPFALQCSIFKAEVRNLGCAEATRASARAGFSEHQLGTTADLAMGWRRLSGDAPIDDFLTANAHKYGWILSYPAGSEEATGYKNEPWHYRYLGPRAASDLVERSGPVRRLSTQEYLLLIQPSETDER